MNTFVQFIIFVLAQRQRLCLQSLFKTHFVTDRYSRHTDPAGRWTWDTHFRQAGEGPRTLGHTQRHLLNHPLCPKNRDENTRGGRWRVIRQPWTHIVDWLFLALPWNNFWRGLEARLHPSKEMKRLQRMRTKQKCRNKETNMNALGWLHP